MADLPLFAQELAREAQQAGEAKQDQPVMVVLGNPPYSGHSANKGEWIRKLLRGEDTITDSKTESYFEMDGEPLGERNPKWLNDDYVKFIRFSQWRIEQTGFGILAFITNHGYPDNPTFRGMRQSLMATFDDIYVLDLHGNSKKKGKAPDGTADKNVFDIQQGVSIGIFVKKKGKSKKPATVRHAELWGTRDGVAWAGEKQLPMGGKYGWLYKHDITNTKWEKLRPEGEWYLYKPIDKSTFPEYASCWKIIDILDTYSVGIITSRDAFVIDVDDGQLKSRIREFRDQELQQSIRKYKLRDVRETSIKKSHEMVKSLRVQTHSNPITDERREA